MLRNSDHSYPCDTSSFAIIYIYIYIYVIIISKVCCVKIYPIQRLGSCLMIKALDARLRGTFVRSTLFQFIQLVNEYMVIDSGGYVCTYSIRALIAACLDASQGS